MKLKSLINLLLRNSNDSFELRRVEILWKKREELLHQIESIHTSFEDSTDALNSPEVITDSIINEMFDKVQIYNKKDDVYQSNIQLAFKKARGFDFYNDLTDEELIQKIKLKHNIIEEQKEGSYFIQLSNDELYHLFSLEEWRQKQLNKLV